MSKIEEILGDGSWLSHPSAFKEFLQSHVWAEISKVLELRLETERMALENAEETMELYRRQGLIRAIREMQALPEQIYEAMVYDQESAKQQDDLQQEADDA